MIGLPSCPRLGRRGHVSTGRSGGGGAAGDTSDMPPVPLVTPAGDVPVTGAVLGTPGAALVVPAAALTAPDTPTAPALVSPAGAITFKHFNRILIQKNNRFITI